MSARLGRENSISKWKISMDDRAQSFRKSSNRNLDPSLYQITPRKMGKAASIKMRRIAQETPRSSTDDLDTSRSYQMDFPPSARNDDVPDLTPEEDNFLTAVSRGYVEDAEALLSAGVNINVKNSFDR